MAELQEDIRTAIEAHLPAQVSGLLVERLRAGDTALAKVAELEQAQKRMVDAALEQGRNTKLLRAELDGWGKRLQDLEQREAAVLDAEHRLEVADLQRKAEYQRAEAVTEIVRLVFQNNQYKYARTAQGTEYVPVPTGSYASMQPFNRTDTETREG